MEWIIVAMGGALLPAAAAVAPAFTGPAAAYQADVARGDDPALVRRVAIEERTGVARHAELVRVPLFFAAGECPEPDAVTIVDASGAAVVSQADDVRRGPDGGVSRMELWFEADLAAWERKHFRLVHHASGAEADPMAARVADGALHVRDGADEVVIALAGAQAGRLLRLGPEAAPALAAPDGLGPDVELTAKDTPPLTLPGNDRKPEVTWAAGPLFVKVVARWRADGGAMLEQVYRIPRHGGGLALEQTILPPDGGKVVLARRTLLAGELAAGDARIVAVPAELRPELRGVSGATVSALVTAPNRAVVVVPVTNGGGSGRMTLTEGQFTLGAPAHLAGANRDAPAGTLRAFWTAAELVPAKAADADALWSAFHRRVQPLVAIVDEPGIGRTELQAALQTLVREMKPVGWRQKAGRAAALGHDASAMKIMQQEARGGDDAVAALEHAAQAARRKLTDDGRKRLRDDQKGRAAGPLDPYDITYTHSAAAVLAAMGLAPERAAMLGQAHAIAARAELGRTAADGFPYLDCFARALNMQMGPLLFGLAGRPADASTATFYRDLAGSPAIRAVYGRAVRPYALRTGEGDDASDTLYQAVTDFWMRAAELTSGENLELSPLAFARYTDCVDVMADRYHGADAGDRHGEAPPPRANFWRSQPNTHRWLGWSCAPFIRLIETPGDLTGATEAVHFCEMLRGRWKNWPDLTYYVLAALLTREDFKAAPAIAALPKPADVRVASGEGGVRVEWSPVGGAAAYRVYRLRTEDHGATVRWLRSPYSDPPGAPVRETSLVDPEGRASDRYVVTAVDADGRESRWFPEETEPGPRAE